MSTRSIIGNRSTVDGAIKYVYCHGDGYPSHNGKLLLENYKTQADVDKLIAGGDLSVLGASIGEKHPFNEHQQYRGMCRYYHRDRDEKWEDVKPRLAVTAADVDREEYLYVWDGKKWLLETEAGLVELTMDMCAAD